MILVHVTGFKTKMSTKSCTVYNAEGADQMAQKHIAAGSLTVTLHLSPTLITAIPYNCVWEWKLDP